MSFNEESTSLEDILSQTSLKEYIEKNWSPLKKSGSNFSTLCPFHDDKSPSMSVSDEKGLYHCFTCKAGGNLITFVKEFKNLNSAEAIQEIASFFNIKLQKTFKNYSEDSNLNKQMYDLNNLIASLFMKYLAEGKERKVAIDYLISRGFDNKDISNFSLGFAPNKWDFLSSFLKKKKIPINMAHNIGLISKKDDKDEFFDFFRNRIIFPIKNRQGNILGFAGRNIGDEKPKYINSKESPIFMKRKILYGIDKFTNLKGSKPKYIFIVEGYTDVMMMNKFGIYNVVATMGTSLTIEHANEIKKFSSKVIMCYDSDKAGFDSSFKSIEPLYQLGIEVYTLRLQSNYDPCSFIKEFGKAKFIDAAKNSTLIIEEYIDYLKEEYLEKNISINEMVSSFILKVKFVQDPIQRDISINKFTSSLSITKVEVENILMKETSSESISIGGRPESLSLNPEDVILKTLIEIPEIRKKQTLKDISEVIDSDFHLLLLSILSKDLKIEPSQLITSIEGNEERSMLSSLIFNPLQLPDDTVGGLKMINDCIRKIKLTAIKDKKRRINLKLSRQDEISEDEEQSLLNELKNLLEQEKNIEPIE